MTNPTPIAAGVAFLVHALLSSVMTRATALVGRLACGAPNTAQGVPYM